MERIPLLPYYFVSFIANHCKTEVNSNEKTSSMFFLRQGNICGGLI
jgi:hypothetical protein